MTGRSSSRRPEDLSRSLVTRYRCRSRRGLFARRGNEIAEDADNMLLLHYHGFRDLQLQPVRIECRPTQETIEFVDQVRILELPHRQVRAHRYRRRVADLVAHSVARRPE
jgi:hypothetical protein